MKPSREVGISPLPVSRRGLVAAVAGATAASLAGCSLLEDDEIARSASPAAVDSATMEATQFDHDGTSELTGTRTVEVAGESRELRLTNYLAAYRKTVPAVEGAVATVQLFSTPSVRIAGQEANPFASFDTRRLLSEILSLAGEEGFEDVEEVGSRRSSVLGAQRTFTLHETTARRQGLDIDISLPVARFTHDGDVLGVFAAYPKLVGENAGVYEATEGVVHPAKNAG